MNTRKAPCKINLTLDILRKRPDGFHDMRMVMQTISLADTVTLEEVPVKNTAGKDGPSGTMGSDVSAFTLRAAGLDLPAGKATLEEQAARAFFAAVGQPQPPLAVTLKKTVPAYAGLGGGSADVAALLRLLRAAYAPGLSTAELERIGLSIGSDMPFCVRGGTALAEGRGEILTDLTPFPPCAFVVCKPDFGIPTPSLFALADAVPIQNRPDTAGMMEALARGDLAGAAARIGNVFEEVLPAEYREVFEIKKRLLSLGALNAAMSGSGPAVFGIFRDEASARTAAAKLERDYRETFVCTPVGRLADWESGVEA